MKKSEKQPVSIDSRIILEHFSIAEIMAQAGFDWLCIDMEHTGNQAGMKSLMSKSR
jgi:2-keto-3-deoxy-L-rhamnonate aldolase RhmA